jgi:hypothetical protein
VPPSGGQLVGIVVRNGSISGFTFGIDLSSANGSIVEGLRVLTENVSRSGIVATGIVRGNTVVGVSGGVLNMVVGISAKGIITGNYVFSSKVLGMRIGQGSTVIGNTVLNTFAGFGISVDCPSNVTDNTAINNFPPGDIVLNGDGCLNTNNVGRVGSPP